MPTESQIQRAILNRIGSMPDCRLFRNTVGVGFVGRPPRRISFGLAPGSADLIGVRRYMITRDDVGHDVGVFVSLEVKRDGKTKARPEQHNWANMVMDMGGIAHVVHDPEYAFDLITNWTP